MNANAAVGARSQAEWWLLYLPALGGLFFGLGVFLFGGSVGTLVGFPGNDSFLYRLAGAATLGYPVALVLGIRQHSWASLRLPIIAVLAFNIASIFTCALEILGGGASWIVYVILLASIIFIAISLRLLPQYAGEHHPTPDITPRTRYALLLGGVLSAAFGLLPLIAPAPLSQLVGYKGTDVFIIRQAGASSLGYAVMAIFALRSGVWEEIRLMNLMGLIFNFLAFVASVVAVISGEALLIVLVIGAASLLYTVLASLSAQRKGKL